MWHGRLAHVFKNHGRGARATKNQMAKDLAIVLNNGSVNSAVATSIAAQKYRPIMVYGDIHPHETPLRRKAAYDLQVAHFKPFREHTIAMQFLAVSRDKAHGAMTTSTDPRVAAPVLPTLRDLTALLGAAVSLATAYEASAIYVGLVVGPLTDDLAQATEFLQVWNEMIQLTLGRPELDVIAPLLELEPWQVIDLGYQVGAPLEKTWNCADEHGEPCGSCRGCRTRDAAFMQAAKPDPLKLAARKV